MPTSVSTRTSGSLNPTRQQLDELDALLQRMLELPVNPLEESGQSEAESEEVADEPPPPPPVVRPQATKPAAPPISYMVVETASPRPLPPASGFEPRPSLTPRLVPVAPLQEDEAEDEPEPPAAAAPESATDGADESEVWVPLRSTWQPSAQTWQPLADSWHQANGSAALPTFRLDAPQPAAVPAPLPIESVQRSEPVVEQPARPFQDKTSETPIPPAPIAPTPAEPRLSLTAEDAPATVPSVLLPLLWFNQGFDACMDPLGAAGRWLCGSSGRQTLGLAGLACLAAAAVIALSAGMGWTW